jgi:hypothetical protein
LSILPLTSGRHAADKPVAEQLDRLQRQAVDTIVHSQKVAQGGHLAAEGDIDDGAHHLEHDAFARFALDLG